MAFLLDGILDRANLPNVEADSENQYTFSIIGVQVIILSECVSREIQNSIEDS
jgi:hypothetical protein